VTCGAEILPTELLKQLKIGGKMVIPMGKQTNKFSTDLPKFLKPNLKKKNLEL
jgi:protein-L-isoaspartate(D-aspartate) O-methyltransferase